MTRELSCDKETRLLKKRYRECAEKVKENAYLSRYADEKIVHSLQVVGAGNFILKHEKIFSDKDGEQQYRAKLAYLFHDIGRFPEIEAMLILENPARWENSAQLKLSHGVLGADYLRQFTEYNLPEIIIPIKRHCDLPEAFYTDEELLQISNPALKQDVIDNYKLACDADKIANFALFTRAYNKLKTVFYGHLTPEEVTAPVSAEILQYFDGEKLVPSLLTHSLCDRILSVICWIFDLNYCSSFNFCLSLHLFEQMLKILREHNPEQEVQDHIERKTDEFLAKRLQQF